jgi:hypothetical protein
LWKIVYVADSKSLADHTVALLKSDGILATARSCVHCADEGTYEVLVPTGEAEEAQESIRVNQMSLLRGGAQCA